MAKTVAYAAFGEEANRGTAEKTTVGFLPASSTPIPTPEFTETPRNEFRGEDSLLGDYKHFRFSQKWNASFQTPLFSEAGTVPGMLATLFKHALGKAVSSQNESTGQYIHFLEPVSDMFADANLGSSALTYNAHWNEGGTVYNHPCVGGRVGGFSISQSPGDHAQVTFPLMGQLQAAREAEIGSPIFAPENLRCDYNNLSLYTGSISRTGSAGAFTDVDVSSATPIIHDNCSLEYANGVEDKLQNAGVNYPTRSNKGKSKTSFTMSLDYDAPSTGFSSAEEYKIWTEGISTTNMVLVWDTGTQAGTGDNHQVIIDIPKLVRKHNPPEIDLEKESMINLNYEALVDPTIGYQIGLYIKNTATTV